MRRLTQRYGAFGQSTLEIHAIDQLGGDVVTAVLGSTRLVNRHDSGMVQWRKAPRFGKERFDGFLACRSMAIRRLDRYPPLQRQVQSAIHDTKRPAT